jgi:hypothetical protein
VLYKTYRYKTYPFAKFDCVRRTSNAFLGFITRDQVLSQDTFVLSLIMGLKSYFRKPASKDVEPSEMKDTVSGSLTPWGMTSHTPMSQESSSTQDVAMQRLNDARCELMVNHLWSQQAKLFWYSQEEDEGVVIKQSRGSYVCCPPDLCRPDGFFDAISALNVKVSTSSRSVIDARTN